MNNAHTHSNSEKVPVKLQFTESIRELRSHIYQIIWIPKSKIFFQSEVEHGILTFSRAWEEVIAINQLGRKQLKI
jgi:hypothetical protein